jgi:hypothetical protein
MVHPERLAPQAVAFNHFKLEWKPTDPETVLVTPSPSVARSYCSAQISEMPRPFSRHDEVTAHALDPMIADDM